MFRKRFISHPYRSIRRPLRKLMLEALEERLTPSSDVLMIGTTQLGTAVTPSQPPNQPSGAMIVQLQDGRGNTVAAASNLTVNLTSSSSGGEFLDLSGNPLPNSSVSIPSGSSFALFEYEDSQTGMARIQAETSDGSASGSTRISVGNGGTQPGTYAVIVSPWQAAAVGQPSQPLTVQLQDNNGNPITATSAVTLTLNTSSSTGKFLYTSGNPLTNNSITIPVGSSTAEFEYEDSQVGLPTLSASSASVLAESAPQQEDIGGVSLLFTTTPQTYSTGQASQPITVQLQDSNGNAFEAASDMTIDLRSSFVSANTSGKFLDTSGNPLSSPSITIAAGSSSASFEYESTWGGTPTLTASFSGATFNGPSLSATQQETIRGMSSVAFTTSPQTVTVGQVSQPITLQLLDNNGNVIVAPNGGASFSVFDGEDFNAKFFDVNGNPLSSGPGGATLTIPAGSSTVSFEFQSTKEGPADMLLLLPNLSSTSSPAPQREIVQAGAPNSLAFLTLPQSMSVGVASGSIIVQLEDKYNNAVPAGSGGLTFNLLSTSSSGQFLSASGDPLTSPSVTIPQGAYTAIFEYDDSQPGTPVLGATADGLSFGQQETIIPTASEIHVTNTNDSGDGSLRAAITAADANPGSTIVFDAGVTGAIELLSALPSITANTNILGPGANLLTIERSPSAKTAFLGFNIQPASETSFPPVVTIAGLTVANFNDTGIYGGYLTLKQVVVQNNTYDGQFSPLVTMGGIGGGITVGNSLTVLDSTISDNTANDIAGDGAGGIDSDGGYTAIINSTISGNQTNDGGTGGLRLATCNASIANSTISGNSNYNTGEISTAVSNGGIISPASIVTLYDTIVAGNTNSGANSVDVGEGLISLGHNLLGAANSNSGFLSSDQVGTTTNPIDPKLGPLQNNGGPTPTMALLTGSPAIAAGSSANAPTTDQRGDARPTSSAVDIGAFEATGPSSNPIALNPTTLPAATLGTSYNQSITATGGSGTLNLADNVPSNTLGLNFSLNGGALTISGTPTTAGAVNFTVTANDTSGDTTGPQSYTLTVNAPTSSAPPSISPPPPPPPLVLNVPPLLAFFDSLLGGVETINHNDTETITDSLFGSPLLVSTFDSSGNLESVTWLGIDVTLLFELL